MTSIWLGPAVAAVLLLVLYTPGPGRRLRHRMMYGAARKVWAGGSAVVGVRVVAGRQDGLTTSWRRGAAVVTPGRVDFTRYVAGMSFYQRPAPPMQIVGIDGPPRRIRGSALLWLDPDCQVTTLRTPTATVEFAVMPPIPAESVLARLRWPAPPG